MERKIPPSKVSVIHLVFAMVFLMACVAGAPSPQPLSDSFNTKRELVNQFRHTEQITIVYEHSFITDLDELKTWTQELIPEYQNRTIHFLSTDKADSVMLANSFLIYIGSISGFENMGKTQWDPAIDSLISSANDNPRMTKDKRVILRIVPNPWNPKKGFSLLAATSMEKLQQMSLERQGFGRRRRSILSRGLDYELRLGDKIEVMGNYSRELSSLWDWRSGTKWKDLSTSDTLSLENEGMHFILHGKVEKDQYLELSDAWTQSRTKLMSLNKEAITDEPLFLHLYDRSETKALLTANSRHFHIGEEKNIGHLILNKNEKAIDKGWVNQLLLAKYTDLWSLNIQKLGLAVSLCNDEELAGLSKWVLKIRRAGLLPEWEELVDNKAFNKYSDYQQAMFAAAWFEFMKATWGEEKIFTQAFDPQEGPQLIKLLKKQWKEFRNKVPPSQNILESNRVGESKQQVTFMQGFNFAHEGYGVYNGYGSSLAMESLQKMAAIGSNTMAIVPYTFMRDPTKASWLSFFKSAGGENDEALIQSVNDARKLGIKSILKPQIWLRGSWPGDIEMTSEKEWDNFFWNYKIWISHYAILAEIHEIEILCIGVEMGKTTLQKEGKWRELIADIRQLYSGKLVYAANWGEEFEKLSFWDELDYIGVDFYYPLSKESKVAEKELLKGLDLSLAKAERIAERYNKPFLFTEIGFRSIPAPWKHPHAEPSNELISVEDQALCYKAVLKRLPKLKNNAGILWWKWPSYLDYDIYNPQGFSPHGKPAMKEVEKSYTKLKR